MQQDRVNVSLYLTAAERERLRAVAREDDLSINQLIRRALRPWLQPASEAREPAGAE